MHPAQQNEFVGAFGHHHVLSPLGYGIFLKTVVRGTRVRSAREQFVIQQIAQDFDSPILHIPKVGELVSRVSYTMEQLYYGTYVPPKYYRFSHPLLKELVRFYFYMNERGYFPYGYTLLAFHGNGESIGERFALIDFSLFGTLSTGQVYFKHICRRLPILEAEIQYGLVQMLVEHPEKIEESLRVRNDSGVAIKSSCATPI
jgi:hypothetical protein